MKNPYFLFLVFLIVLSVVAINPVYASVESLYVDGYSSVTEEWDETDASPWLNDSDANYISTSTDEYWHEEFTFADGYGSGTINSVYFYVEINGPSARNDRAEFHIWDGTSWVNVLNQDPDGDAYVIYNVEVSTTLDDWTKIDGAKLKVQYQKSGSPSTETIYVRRAYLYVDYTISGTDYVADFSQSISSTWAIVTKTDFKIVPSQSLTTSWNVLTEWDAILDLTQSVTSSWDILVSHGMFVDLSQGISSTWDLITEWDAIVDFSQAISTSWDVLMQSTFNIIPTQAISTTWNILTQSTFNVVTSLANTFTWTVEVIRTVGGTNYIADLSQSVTTTWNVLTQWDAILDITQAITTTWEIIIQSTFSVIPSLSQTFSWTIDVITGTQSEGTRGVPSFPTIQPQISISNTQLVDVTDNFGAFLLNQKMKAAFTIILVGSNFTEDLPINVTYTIPELNIMHSEVVMTNNNITEKTYYVLLPLPSLEGTTYNVTIYFTYNDPATGQKVSETIVEPLFVAGTYYLTWLLTVAVIIIATTIIAILIYLDQKNISPKKAVKEVVE